MCHCHDENKSVQLLKAFIWYKWFFTLYTKQASKIQNSAISIQPGNSDSKDIRRETVTQKEYGVLVSFMEEALQNN